MYVYIITNPGKTVFYTGVTNDLSGRLYEHEQNKGTENSFAGKYYCYKLLYYEEIEDPMTAINREKEIKKLSHEAKIKLIKTKNVNLDILSFKVRPR